MIYEINRWQLLVFRGRLKEAVTLAQQICQKRPRDLSLRLALVQELFRLNEIKAAGTLAQESLKLFDSLTTEEKNRLELEISSTMCMALLQSLVEWSAGHKEGAIHCLDTAAKAGPPHPIVDRLRGEAYLRLEADEAALKAFQSVLKTHPEDVEALCGQGRCWMRLQRFDEALDAVLTASELRPASAPIQLLLAQIFEANSQAEMAQAALALCLKLDPHNTEAKAALNRLSD
jgi:tetratricopeptide (TPR) repeat protein